MGGPAAQFKAFADASSYRWSQQRWADKIAAGFTTGACAGGDQLHTLTYFTILAAQHGHALVRTRHSRRRGSERPQSFGQPVRPCDTFGRRCVAAE
ncbi:flavodoxin family protein [Bradyrhizobium japonicum]